MFAERLTKAFSEDVEDGNEFNNEFKNKIESYVTENILNNKIFSVCGIQKNL